MTDNTQPNAQEQGAEVVETEDKELSYEEQFEAEWGDDKTKPVEVQPEVEEGEPSEAAAEADPVESGEQGSSEDNAQAATAEASAPVEDDPYAWINDLPPEVRKQAEDLRHDAVSNQGRVAAYNRRLSDLREERDRIQAELRSRTPAQQSQDSAKEPAPAADELPEDFKKLKEDFPEFADAVDSIREFDRRRYEEQLNTALQPLNQAQLANQRKEFDSAVDRAAEEIFNTKESGVDWHDVVKSEDFLAWLDMQPQMIRDAARSPDVKSATYVLTQYETDYQAAVAELEAQKPASGDQSSAPSKADKTRASRSKRQEQSVGLASKPIISDPTNQGGDYDAEFDRQWG